MSRRCAGALALVILLAIAMLLACNSTYSASSDGLVIVPSFGSAAVQSFSFNLTNGHISTLNSAPPILGQPTAMALDPSGNYAYVTIVPNPPPNGVFQSVALSSIATYAINSDGTVADASTPPSMLTICPNPLPAPAPPYVSCPALLPTDPGFNPAAGKLNPTAVTMDSAGQYLFVADQQTTDYNGNTVPGSISVFSIGSGGTLTEVTGSPFTVPVLQLGPTTIANLTGLAVTPTKYPVLNTQAVANAECSLVQQLPPSTPEYLYVADANNNVVWAFTVQSNGVLSFIVNPSNGVILTFPADSVTRGVAVDPCNRFVFVTNNLSNNVSAYAICNGTSPARPSICDSNQYPEGSLVQVPGSPFALGGGPSGPNGPTVLEVDPLANYLYVVDNQSNSLSCFRITQVNGGLAPLSTASVITGINPFAIAIRADDNWVFVASNESSNGFGVLSQYELAPATGILTPFGTGIQTDNFPTAVVVK
jgi:6-phosphogluconolactonase (cycloisomerase 2 family)